jgi:hypothetical protein
MSVLISVTAAALRFSPVRRAATKLSDRDIGRSLMDAALHSHAATSLARRGEAESARRTATPRA